MAVTLRLQLHGTHNAPFYHVVAADSRKKLKGQYLERLGYYDPRTEPSVMVIEEDRVKFWYAQGATVSSAVKAILKQKKVTLERTRKVTRQPKPAKATKAKG